MAERHEKWQDLKRLTAERFGEDSVFGEGSLDARLAIVGEAPGEQEARQGSPFVGRAGKLLDQLLEEAGIDRSEVYITNVVKVRPTREKDGRLQNRPPRAAEIREGMETLREELALVEPEVLVLLGGVSAKAIIEKSFTMSSGRGEWSDTEFGCPALATYHPAYLLRLRGGDFERAKKGVLEDLALAWRRARG